MNTTQWTDSAALTGMIFALVTGLTVAFVVVARFLPGARRHHRLLVGIGIWGVVFQVVHFAEHAIQFGYWVGNPNEKPYITPWGSEAAEGLAYWCKVLPGTGQGPARGVEMLHLLGNGIFLAGLGAFFYLAHDLGLAKRSIRALRWGFWLEAFHVVEHLALTITFFVGGTARGISTAFGLVDPSSRFTVNYRITWHFVMNLVATVLGIMATRELAKQGALSSAHDDDPGETPAASGIAPAPA